MTKQERAVIENRLETIGKLTSYPSSREEAERVGQTRFLSVDTYKGHLLMLEPVGPGGQDYFSFRNRTRLNTAAFIEMLDAMIFGLEYVGSDRQ